MLLRFALLLAVLAAVSLRAQSVWEATTNKNWSNSINWSDGVPNSDTAVAQFGSSAQPDVNITGALTVDRIEFTAEAAAHTFSHKSSSSLTLAGAGIINSSSSNQTFAIKATADNARLAFANSASAGNAVISAQGTLSQIGSALHVAQVDFQNSSSAGSAKLTVSAGGEVTFSNTATAANSQITMKDLGSYVTFRDSSTAGSAAFTSHVGGHSGLSFMDSSSAGQADIRLTPGDSVSFWNNSSAGSATIDNSQLSFGNNSTAGNATITVRGLANFNGFSTAGSASFNVMNDQQLVFNGNSSLGSASVTVRDNAAIVFNASSTGGSGVISGKGGLIKNGSGVVTLTGASTYTGATQINGGKLFVSGSLGNTASVTVGDGATLGGSGIIGGITTVLAGGRLEPGSTRGTLTFTSGLTLANKSIIEFGLGTVSDLIRLTGGTLTGPSGNNGIKINLSDSGGFTAGTYTLFDFTTGSVSLSDFSLNDLIIGKTIPGFDYSLAFEGDTLTLTATASAIPEPSTYAALLGLAALGFCAWRKRRTR